MSVVRVTKHAHGNYTIRHLMIQIALHVHLKQSSLTCYWCNFQPESYLTVFPCTSSDPVYVEDPACPDSAISVLNSWLSWSSPILVSGPTPPSLAGSGSGTVQINYSVNLSCKWQHVCVLIGCLTSKQHASVSLEPICSDSCTCSNFLPQAVTLC